MQSRSIKPLMVMVAGGVLVIAAAIFLIALPGEKNAPVASTPTSPSPAVEQSYPEIPRVSLADAKAAFDSKSAVIVDARDPVSYNAQHIPGALSFPVSDLPSRLTELDKSKWIITYCT